jgi:hypothetical protein
LNNLYQCAWSIDTGHRHGDPVHTIKSGPPVNSTSVVADLNPSLRGLDGLHEMDVHASGDPGENDVAHLDQVRINRSDDDFVTTMDEGDHRVASWPKRDGLTSRNSLCDLLQHRNYRSGRLDQGDGD